MSDNSIFETTNGSDQNPNNSGASNTAGVQPNNDITTILSEIKNEQGEPKYKNVQEALNALKHSQSFIPTLKQELEQSRAEAARLKAESEKMAELERTVAALTQGQQKTEPTSPGKVDEETIASIVQKSLNEARLKALRDENLSTVVKTMQEKFGAEAGDKFYGEAQKLGFSKAEINDLAAKNPAAVLQLLGVNQAQGNSKTTPNTSTINTNGMGNQSDSFVRANVKSVMIGATSQEMIDETRNARKLVDELHSQGKSVYDLTDPKVYFQQFKR